MPGISPAGATQLLDIASLEIKSRYDFSGLPGRCQSQPIAENVDCQKLNTLASAARSIKWGPPSKTMFEKNFASST